MKYDHIAFEDFVYPVILNYQFLPGLITGGLVTKFGTKICGCFGAMLSATGIAVCFIAPNLEFLIIFMGVMSGYINLIIERYCYIYMIA